MNPDLPTQLPANVDNAPTALGAARYPQAANCMDKSYAASNTKFRTRPFRATQTARVASASLLINHFGVVQRYPQAHVVGIFDAITELKRQSFLGLRVIGFQVHASIKAEFERDVSRALSIN